MTKKKKQKICRIEFLNREIDLLEKALPLAESLGQTHQAHLNNLTAMELNLTAKQT